MGSGGCLAAGSLLGQSPPRLVSFLKHMRELELVCESTQPSSGKPQLKVSQVCQFETYGKSMKIKGPLIPRLLLLLLSTCGQFS